MSESRRIRVVTVDDEPPARSVLREFLGREEGFDLEFECAGGREAIFEINERVPDLVLLDIQMPEVDGFEVLAQLVEPLPLIIMVTAHDQHAVRAFDYHALDYVLKPIDEERLRLALRRARERIDAVGAARAADGARSLRGAWSSFRQKDEPITIKCTDTLLCVQPGDIAWLEAAGNYVKFEYGGRQHLTRSTLTEFLERLDSTSFFRVHRSYAVNLAFVTEVRPARSGHDSLLLLGDGTEIPLGRSFRKALLDRLNQDPAEG